MHILIEICHNWFFATDNSKDTNIIHTELIDYSKAFDQINPIILLDKFKQFNIPDFLLHWISDTESQSMIVTYLIWGTVLPGITLGVIT